MAQDLIARGINAGAMAFYVQEVVEDQVTGEITPATSDTDTEKYLGGTSDATISLSRATIETTNKDVDYAQYITSFLNWEGSFSGFVSYTDSNDGVAGTAGYANYSELFDILNCRKLIRLRFRQITDRGDAVDACGNARLDDPVYPYFEGLAYLTDLEQTANQGEAVTMSGTFQGTGTISLITP